MHFAQVLEGAKAKKREHCLLSAKGGQGNQATTQADNFPAPHPKL